MRIQIDSLKYAKMLKARGFPTRPAEALVSVLTEVEIQNVYSISEVNSMLSESIKGVFDEHEKALKEVFDEQEKALANQRREFDAHHSALKAELKEGRDRSDRVYENLMGEIATSRRWAIATIITVGFSIATYLAALFRLGH
ncbi:hypothetical protein [Legionella maceachernii]|uniref:Coiled-coil protein n=1 Tax=Legionella maceachernii TaxID=466 RepID=A0A0W0VYU2_9GAMM|nr:hypothetical protein [Legionella maceachernii]KTD25161.1 hypothetical protein Lmac_2139 [Legionella maceachernii]SKA27192.1 hypothetical protein SAMN02745128_02948 [Legionella maceachernii]SUP04587.1 Uncharacterised protein [Legionella maceachernii]